MDFSPVIETISAGIAVFNGKSQRNQDLLLKRISVMDDFEKFIFEILPDWHWEGDVSLIAKHSETELHGLFGQPFVYLRNMTLETANTVSILKGDYDHAERKGHCRGRDMETIVKEKSACERNLQDYFIELKEMAKEKKWI